MQKAKRFIGSRYFVAGLCLLLELLQIVAIYLTLYRFFLPLTILAWVINFAVLVYLISRDDIPEFKILWFATLSILPILGAFLFILLSGNTAGKRAFRRYECARSEIQQRLPDTGMERILDRTAFCQAHYLYRADKMPCYTGSEVVYYKSGEAFHQALLHALQEAESFIFMEYFIVGEGKMWDSIHTILREKAANGCLVCVLYDDLGCISKLPDRYYQQLQKEGICCIPARKFTPIVSMIHNNRDHRKITVIDGKVGFTGGVNLADEYINAFPRYGHWKDSALRIKGAAVASLTALFLMSWNAQNEDALPPERFLTVSNPVYPEKGHVIPFGDGPAPIYRDNVGETVYLNLIHAAKQYLYITTPYFVCDHALTEAICIAAKKGVDVRMIMPKESDSRFVQLLARAEYKKLLCSGVRVYEYTPGFIHAKNVISDDAYAVCGTINLDYRSLVHHFECGVWMHQTCCIADMKEDFLKTAAESEEIKLTALPLKKWQHMLTLVMKLFSPLL